jgi:hypothetical protein
MKSNATLVVLGGALLAGLGLWALASDAGSAWMVVAAIATAALAAGFAQSGRDFAPMAAGFAVFSAAHVYCAFDQDAVPVVLSAGLVIVTISSIITGVRVLRGREWTDVTRFLPLVSGLWGITIPLALALGGFTAHHIALSVYGVVWATLGVAISRVDTRRPALV